MQDTKDKIQDEGKREKRYFEFSFLISDLCLSDICLFFIQHQDGMGGGDPVSSIQYPESLIVYLFYHVIP